MIAQIVSMLFELMTDKFRNFPSDYLTFDVETTGTRFHKPELDSAYNGDLITELGFCHVRNNVATDYAGLILDWTRVKNIDQNWLKERLATTKHYVEFRKDGTPSGKTYHMTYERMAAEGGDPFDVLYHFAELLRDTRACKNFFVAHNGYRFDTRYIQDHLKHCINNDFVFNDNELIDTGMIFKAAQIGNLPWQGDSPREWNLRIARMSLKGVHWTLDRDCVPFFGLDIKHGLDMTQAHGAGFDSYLTHLLIEEYKQIKDGKRPDPLLIVPPHHV